MRLSLSVEDMFLELDPCAGGAVSAWRHRDLEILRPGPARIGPAFDAMEYASFAMVPYVGRIHEGRFVLGERAYELPANFPPEPHSIHGHGWCVPWKVETQGKTSATLYYRHTADAWPWAYIARQTFDLSPNGLSVALSVTNESDSAMPAGLGWHPYFMRDEATLYLPTAHVWTPDEVSGDNLPSPVTSNTDLTGGRVVSDLNLDTTFSVGTEPVRMEWSSHRVTMTSDPIFSHATVYVPPEQNFFCVEPVSHAPNAVNSALPAEQTGFRALAPGETLSGSIALVVDH